VVVVTVVRVDAVVLGMPGSISSLGFIGNPVSVEFLAGALVVLLASALVTPSDIIVYALLYPAIVAQLLSNSNPDPNH